MNRTELLNELKRICPADSDRPTEPVPRNLVIEALSIMRECPPDPVRDSLLAEGNDLIAKDASVQSDWLPAVRSYFTTLAIANGPRLVIPRAEDFPARTEEGPPLSEAPRGPALRWTLDVMEGHDRSPEILRMITDGWEKVDEAMSTDAAADEAEVDNPKAFAISTCNPKLAEDATRTLGIRWTADGASVWPNRR